MILNGEDIDTVDYSDVTNMNYMFYRCSDLEYLEKPMGFVNYEWNKEMHPKIFKKYPELFKGIK